LVATSRDDGRYKELAEPVTEEGAGETGEVRGAGEGEGGNLGIVEGIAATRTGFELIKSLRELVKRPETDASEVLARLLELQELMLDARNALNDAQDEKAKLESRITELARMADFGKDFRKAHGVYWHETYPYCPVCWDVDRKPVRLSGPISVPNGGPMDQWTCPFHKQAISIRWDDRSEMKRAGA